MTSFKDQGNAEFKAGAFLKAAALYTKAIEEDPENSVLYSNRSAAFTKLSKVQKALKDAEKCIEIAPEWDKGYFRKAAALEVAEKFQEALDVYQHALKISPDNKEFSMKIKTLTKLVQSLSNKQKQKPQQ